ncbi:hypothetical protein WR25_08950 [Diploscapter pachys]|uniref:Uncharacterized protein n=1 Tax=Diploscapter pachys TaxID=2018661 RepID=A0A2A2KC86_9BILA|nr:hypothetical protein WR25_08950 [Diploscapter pachys]
MATGASSTTARPPSARNIGMFSRSLRQACMARVTCGNSSGQAERLNTAASSLLVKQRPQGDKERRQHQIGQDAKQRPAPLALVVCHPDTAQTGHHIQVDNDLGRIGSGQQIKAKGKK